MLSFKDFFSTLHPGQNPHPWQEDCAERCAAGDPPSMVCVPTGAGKTAVIDVLIWALATQAERSASDRTVGVRIVWAIDRRILVDEVHRHAADLARRLAEALKNSSDPLHDIATRLNAMSGQVPLVATRWRGGVVNDDGLLFPTQPQIITSTVAQIGSRLLFRGYGVGRGSLSMRAGLAGSDTTICLDEAHLAKPFAETVAAVQRHRSATNSDFDLPPLNLITLTATPGPRPADAITLSAADEKALGPRLTGPKLARLDDRAKTERERAARLTDATADYMESGALKVACVCNTVRQAVTVYRHLRKEQAAKADIALLIGPQRPVDREKVLAGPAATLFTGERPERPVLCVTTQTFEVGLDADVEALVTESASASALVQRFGRLNRRGEGIGKATVVRDEGSWLYADDEALSWQWLQDKANADGEIDISVSALETDTARPSPLHESAAPALTPDVIDLLVQTNPLPGTYQDPDIEPFLSGIESKPSADVSLCWRCDLRPAEITPADDEYRATLLKLMPPRPHELLTLSVRGARALVASLYPGAKTARSSAMNAAMADADIEGRSTDAKTPGVRADVPTPFVLIRHDDIRRGTLGGSDEDATDLVDLAPGDTIVLPSEAGAALGSLDLLGIDEGSTSDMAADLHPQPGTMRIRISPEVLARACRPLKPRQWASIASLCASATRAKGRAREDVVKKVLERLQSPHPEHAAVTPLCEADGENLRLTIGAIGPVTDDDLLDEEEQEGAEDAVEDGQSEQALDGEDTGVDAQEAMTAGQTWVIAALPRTRKDRGERTDASPPPTIAAHAEAVCSRVRELASLLGLSPSLTIALEQAARAHDHGKANPVIQAFYREGVHPIGEPPIAKSIFGTGDRRRSEIAARRAGLPVGLHHELSSVAILADALATDPGLATMNLDWDLALHLIATHHGRGRPFPETPRGGNAPRRFHCEAAGIAGTARGDGIEDWMLGDPLNRFWRVNHRYGAWAVSYLEAILMLADRTVSAEGG
jgi:CRISPR-associated endonuclease/helicase Cas3